MSASVHTIPPLYLPAYRIVVYGSPAPQGSKKFLGLTKAGRGILGEMSAKVKPWRQAVQAKAEEARGCIGPSPDCQHQEPIDGPVACRMVFTLAKPASRPKTRRSWATSAPDLSKLVRSTEDALTDAGIWKDDNRVVEYLRTAKVFPGEDPEALDTPGAIIEVYRILPGPPA